MDHELQFLPDLPSIGGIKAIISHGPLLLKVTRNHRCSLLDGAWMTTTTTFDGTEVAYYSTTRGRSGTIQLICVP
jgi:hypothetical protein